MLTLPAYPVYRTTGRPARVGAARPRHDALATLNGGVDGIRLLVPLIAALFFGSAHTQDPSQAGHADRVRPIQAVSRGRLRSELPDHEQSGLSRRRKALAHRHVITAFDACVGNRENGEPGALTLNTIHWHAIVGEYHGAYSFMPATWAAAGGHQFAGEANEATPRDQSRIFNSYSAIDPGAWPNTLPPCLYLR